MIVLLLGISLYQGQKWARLVLMAWAGLGVLGGVPAFLDVLSTGRSDSILMSAVLLSMYVAALAILIVSDGLVEYMTARRAAGSGTSAPKGDDSIA